MSTPVDPPRHLTKAAAAFNSLRSAIDTGDLRPGERIRIGNLVERLGMSPTPIREALRLLQAEGLVAHEPHRGMIVRQFNRESLDDIYLLRCLLEPEATRLAAERATDAQLNQIERLHESVMRSVTPPSNMALARSLNLEWHRAVYAASTSAYLDEFIARLWAQFPVQALWLSSRSVVSVQEHEAVMAALRARDGGQAAQAMNSHIKLAWRVHLARLIHISQGVDGSRQSAE